MAGPLSETLKINGSDAAALARNVKSHAGEIKALKSGDVVTTVTNGFPGFAIHDAAATATTATEQALTNLGTVLDTIGDNTVAVSAAFLHIDEDRAREFDQVDGTNSR
ncbi:hypothetical protein AB0L57_13315 [Nocardia sp. NPDC052254]|uniref:hypothetical protein n=1 Tax=Nocardia sp. NPDC052254 TaxID=3155681 RepID=UPI0034219311